MESTNLHVEQLQKWGKITVGNLRITDLNVTCVLNVDSISVWTRGWCFDSHGIYNHVAAVVKPYMELSAVLEAKPFDSHFWALKYPNRLISNQKCTVTYFSLNLTYMYRKCNFKTMPNHRTVTRTGLSCSVRTLVRFASKVPPLLATTIDNTRALNW